MKRNRKVKKQRRGIASAIIFGIIFLLAAFLYVACTWYNDHYYVTDLQSILFTITSPLKGTGGESFAPAFKEGLPKVFLALLLYCAVAIPLCQRRVGLNIGIATKKKSRTINGAKLLRRIGAVLCVIALVASLWNVSESLGIREYLTTLTQRTTIYEDYYVDPLSVSITEDGKAKNLIYIYLESMETTYADIENGGIHDDNLIPNLTQIAYDNVSFSPTDKLGGFRNLRGATWTMGGLFSSSTGVPFSFPVDGNSMDQYENFASGITTLGDILQQKGYNQEFLCGSNGDFAGRKSFYQQHGNFQVFDYFTAIEKGYVEPSHYVWWGFEDFYLYEIAKDEVLRLAAEGEPFNLTMLTVDTHPYGGYFCELCENEYDSQLANVVKCADRQAAEFVRWCQQQDFYDDTVIVIVGDHIRQDTELVEGLHYSQRQAYNCIINSDKQPQQPENSRDFTTQDMFPTVLSAMGFDIEGDRLGLGTDMFSDKQT
ncbi:MAG: sulfatase-like hydrolase/transferase, partial [Oscillospiraceae bacterium]|nr:sulfatase-like hydrolase/transferase [Oscillospiraceae bacterium]